MNTTYGARTDFCHSSGQGHALRPSWTQANRIPIPEHRPNIKFQPHDLSRSEMLSQIDFGDFVGQLGGLTIVTDHIKGRFDW